MPRKRYLPVKENRLFTFDKKYSEFDWNDFDNAVDAFNSRIQNWYIEPIESLKKTSIHFGFPIVGLTCLLIDTLSQYYEGKLESSSYTFKNFVRTHLNSFSQVLPTQITVPQIDGEDKTVSDFADVLYSGYRCGILHEANVSLYGMIATLEQTVEFFPQGYTKYLDNSDCPSIVIDSHKLFEEVKYFYQNYISNLKDPENSYNVMRDNFRQKFAWSFGIEIGNE